MKRLVLETKSSPNFIGNWNIDDKKLCDEIINFFENNPKLQIKGTTVMVLFKGRNKLEVRII